MYYLNNRYHTATIQKFHSILEANIQILDEVWSDLITDIIMLKLIFYVPVKSLLYIKKNPKT